MSRRSPQILLAVLGLLLPVLLVGGIFLGGHPGLLPFPLRTLLVDEDVRTALEAAEIIEDDYYREVSGSRLLNQGIEGAVRSLDDRFSAYLTPSEYRRFQEQASGEFSGVGLEVTQDARGLRVARVIDGTPAARAGLRPDDLIVAVNGRSIAGQPSSVATALVRGRPGTSVQLTIVSRGRRRVERVQRARVSAQPVESSLRTVGGVKRAVVQLSTFSSGAHGAVRQAIDKQRAAGAKGIVLDLRRNGGGLLEEAVLVSSIFISDGTIVTTKGRASPRRVFNARGGSIPTSVPVVVLVDRGSASASEIVAGALQDRGRAKVVGTRTFGKGVFQRVRELPNGGALEITVGEYFTPKGRNLGGGGVRRGGGVAPDVAGRDRPGTKPDEGLDAALRTLASEAR